MISQDWEALPELRDSIRKLLTRELSPHLDGFEDRAEFPRAAFRQLAEAGMAAPMLGEPYGTGSLAMQAVAAEEMGYASGGFALSALASVCLFGSNVDRLGTEAQKKKYLPGIASGERIGCWALTEPDTGSDAVSIKTRCVRKGDEYLLSGSKTFITNAPIADYFIIIAREVGADGKPVTGFSGATAFILERGMPGLETGKPFHKHGNLCSPTGEVFLSEVRVSKSQILGEAGQAFKGMKHSLDVERVIFSGLGIGLMDFCLDTAVRYAARRKQFGVPIIEHQMVQDKVAEMTCNLELMRSYLYENIRSLNEGKPVTKSAGILKLWTARLAVQTASEAVQCLGGYGYMREYQVERCLRDAKLLEIGGGTSEIQKLIIAKQAIKEILGQ